jgi:hypothetical protein
MLFLSSCLDDEGVGTQVPDFAGSPNVVDFNEMPNSAGYVKRSFEMTNDPNKAYPATLRVNLSSPWQLTEDLVVTVKLDEAAVNKYIADNPTSGFVLLPSSKIGFTEGQVTIPAGQREAELSVTVKTAGIKIEDKFMMAFTITGTNNPNVILSGNFGTQYVAVGVKNFFEGKYQKFLSYFHPTAGGTYPDKPYTTREGEVTLNTVDAVTCDDWLGVWTSDKVLITINPDNSVDLAFPTRPDAFEGDPYDPTHECTYDPATGNIMIYYYYNKAAPRIFWVEYNK